MGEGVEQTVEQTVEQGWRMSQVWIEAAIAIVATILVAIVVRGLLMRAISRVENSIIKDAAKRRVRANEVLQRDADLHDTRHAKRTHTMASLLRNTANIVIAAIVLMVILDTVGVPLSPILASAGIGGVALGFGAQSLVKDYLSGIFMIAEDQYGVGDWVQVNQEISGKVEMVGLRITRLRAFDGTVWYIRNGEILELGNSSQGTSTAIIDVSIAPTAEPSRAVAVMEQVLAEMATEEEWSKVLISDPKVLGVNSVDAVETVIRGVVDTAANNQWGFQRAAMNRTRQAYIAAGIEAPAAVAQANGQPQ